MKKAILLLAFLTTSSLLAQQTTVPVDSQAILKELQKIKESRDTALKSQLSKVYQIVNSAASNPGAATDLYLQAQYETQFDGQNHEKTQFQEWKKKESDKLKSKSFQESLRLYLVYLSLSLQSCAGSKNADLVPAIINYTAQVQSENDFLFSEPNDLLSKPLTSSLIVRGFDVNLTPAEAWVMVPGNVDEMYLKVILPVLREKKDPAAIEYWNRKIDRESAVAATSKRTFDAERFNKVRKPALAWSRAMEYVLIDQKDRGILEMFGVIKNNPTHPNAAEWTQKLEELLNPQRGS